MEPVIIAVGSNVGDRHKHVKSSGRFLSTLSEEPLNTSSIYLTEPVGPATRYFLNAAIKIYTDLSPKKLISTLKEYEKKHGRATDHPRWSARTIDLDIIAYGRLVMQKDYLIIPHPEYQKRLFVLKPLFDLHPDWKDPQTNVSIDKMVAEAPEIQIKETELVW